MLFICVNVRTERKKDLDNMNLNYCKSVRKHLGSDCLCNLPKPEN